MMLATVLTILLLGHAALARELENSAEKESAMLDKLIAAGDRGELPTDEPEYLDYLRVTGRHEEFAKLMGIDNVSLVIPSEDARSEDFMFTTVSPLGDILLTPQQAEQARQGINLDKYGGNRWRNHRVPYVISSDFNEQQKQHITNAINDMSSKCQNVKIVPRNRERDYAYFISGNGCYAYLGRNGGRQVISLQRNGCLSVGTIQHEIMHTIGFTHEHNRPDRDNHVSVLWGNIAKDWHSQYEKVSEEDFNKNGPYEYCSAMHYPINAPGSNEPAFEILDETADKSCMGQRGGLTSTDIKKIDHMYS